MRVDALWRYPVKSLGGEALTEAELTPDGVAGDRLVHVALPWGPITGRTAPGLLTIPAATGPDGRPLVAGHRWEGPEAAELIRAAAGPHAGLVAYDGPERFDVLNLLVATDGAVADLGVDVRRLRPNLLIGGVAPGEERTWGGRALAIGDVLVGVMNLRQRCVVTTIDPDTGGQDVGVLRDINERFEGRVALNCWVIRPGMVRVGDPVELVDAPARPEHVGGWVVGAPYLVDG